MEQKPALFFWGLMLIALILIVVYLIQTDPFENVKPHIHSQQMRSHDAGSEAVYAVYAEYCYEFHGSKGQGLEGHPEIGDTKVTMKQIKQRLMTGKGDSTDFIDEIKEPMLTRLAQVVKNS
ncbi:MAG TPA: hypothetical protein ENK44_04470 [Caldithrix abyssi]|uniref:Cytochrome c n=1 Tax=Caldithrix abyssi TaxID=187145 RepID=A0A7V4WUK1_CALAY|nr:hypothetical protein [Caldithrix abyssi]